MTNRSRARKVLYERLDVIVNGENSKKGVKEGKIKRNKDRRKRKRESKQIEGSEESGLLESGESSGDVDNEEEK